MAIVASRKLPERSRTVNSFPENAIHRLSDSRPFGPKVSRRVKKLEWLCVCHVTCSYMGIRISGPNTYQATRELLRIPS